MHKKDHIFNKLSHRKLNPEEDKSLILLRSDEITFSKSVQWTYYEDIVTFLKEKLKDDVDYYVMDDFRVYKGKTIVKSGETVISNKESIIDYVRETYYSNGKLIEDYVNPILVMQRNVSKEVLCIGHDGENGLIQYKKE